MTVTTRDRAVEVWGWVSLGSGLGLLVGATYLAVDYAVIANSNPTTEQEAQSLANRAFDRSIAGYVLGGVGVAAVTTGVVLLLRKNQPPPADESRASPTVWPTISPGGVGVQGRF